MQRLRKRITAACMRSVDFRDALPVFGEGPLPCRLMIVGEAPGRTETRLKKPFVGRAGKFLEYLLKEGLRSGRDEVYITNVVKVWPHIKTARLKTRKPAPEEERFFIPYLKEEIGIVRPEVIVAVGKTAFSALSPGEEFRNGVWSKGVAKPMIMPIYHPAYVLRQQRKLKENTEYLIEALRKVKRRIARLTFFLGKKRGTRPKDGSGKEKPVKNHIYRDTK
ncbi:MAG: uracil-DNA glycosylase [Deltaproteobacteria bacterium]|nr:uracil-DNA glycosylase [Deltaproteobacteria bacterium]